MTAVVSLTNVSLMLVKMPSITSFTQATSEQLSYYAQSAEQEIFAKISRLYGSPSSAWNMLVDLATGLSLQRFLEERALTGQGENKSDWPRAFDRYSKLLDDIADGSLPLLDNNGAIIATSTVNNEVWSDKTGYLPTFYEDHETLLDVDPNKVDTERTNRETW